MNAQDEIKDQTKRIEDMLHKSKNKFIQDNVTGIADLIGDLKKTIPIAVNDDYKTFYEKYLQLIIEKAERIAQRIDEIN